jgi:hypothetical protein
MLNEYDAVYSVRYCPWFHVTAVGLGTMSRGYGGPPVYSMRYSDYTRREHETKEKAESPYNGTNPRCPTLTPSVKCTFFTPVLSGNLLWSTTERTALIQQHQLKLITACDTSKKGVFVGRMKTSKSWSTTYRWYSDFVLKIYILK